MPAGRALLATCEPAGVGLQARAAACGQAGSGMQYVCGACRIHVYLHALVRVCV
jgi:hypothetical protein